MSADPFAEDGGSPGVAQRMGIAPDAAVIEVGYDEADADQTLRELIEKATGQQILPEDADDIVDVVLLWFREGDGDLADTLVDVIAPLADDGFIWLLSPKRGRDGYVEPSEIAEAASIAGLSQTSITTIGTDWSGARLAGRKGRGGRK